MKGTRDSKLYWNAVTDHLSRWAWADISFDNWQWIGENFLLLSSKLDAPAPFLRRFHITFDLPSINFRLFGGQVSPLEDVLLLNVGLVDWDFANSTTLRKLALDNNFGSRPGPSPQFLADLLKRNQDLETVSLSGVVLPPPAAILSSATSIYLPKLATLILHLDVSPLASLLELLQLPALTNFSIASHRSLPTINFHRYSTKSVCSSSSGYSIIMLRGALLS